MKTYKIVFILIGKIFPFLFIATGLTHFVEMHEGIRFDLANWIFGLMAFWTGMSVPEWIMQSWKHYRNDRDYKVIDSYRRR